MVDAALINPYVHFVLVWGRPMITASPRAEFRKEPTNTRERKKNERDNQLRGSLLPPRFITTAGGRGKARDGWMDGRK